MELKELVEEQLALTKALRAENERLQLDGKNTQKEWSEKMQRQQDRLDAIEIKLARPTVPSPESKAVAQPSAKKEAWIKACRYGVEALTPEEKQAMVFGEAKSLSSGQGMEFLAPPEFVNEIIKSVSVYSQIRAVARVRTSSGKSVKVPKRTGVFAATWTGKTATRTETTGLKYGMEDIPNHELYALVDVPFEDLEDSAFNFESEIQMEAGEQFGVAEGTSFVTGNGVNEAEGFAVNSVMQTNAVVSGDASLLKGNGLIDLFYQLKDAYAQNGTWAMRRSTIGAVRKLQDQAGNYLWQPGLGGDIPNLLMGRPYIECPDMPAVAANAYAVAFGDFRRGYVIVDRIQIVTIRDPFSQAGSGLVRFHMRKRVGGQVVNTEAIKLQKVSA